MAISQQNGNCCPNHFGGFCLDDGTPILVVAENDTELGWINILTGVFTPGAVPPGTTICQDAPPRFLDCDTDSVTVCVPEVTATVSNVAGTNVASVTLLAANPNRKGAILYNDSSNQCFVKFGATASSTSFTFKMLTQTFYELNKGYTGVIDGIWSNSANGAMRITEFS